MGKNSGKFYDARLTKDYCDALKNAATNYSTYADKVHAANEDFFTNEFFKGTTANSMKNFIKNGTGTVLKEVTDLHKQMVDDQTYMITSFENMVDSSANARIEFDTLGKIDKDFKKYYHALVPITKTVKNIVEKLNSEFGEYGNFPQPNNKAAISGFEFLCGGEAEDAGYFKDCQKKLVAFDAALVSYLKGRDTIDRKNSIDTRLSSTKGTFNSFKTYEMTRGDFETGKVSTAFIDSFKIEEKQMK